MLIIKSQLHHASPGGTRNTLRIRITALAVTSTAYLFVVFSCAIYGDPGDRKSSSMTTDVAAASLVQTASYILTAPIHVFEIPVPESPDIVDHDISGTYVLPPILLPPAEGELGSEFESTGEFIIPSHHGSHDNEEIEIGIGCTEPTKRLNFNRNLHQRYHIYRSHQSNLAWLPGSGDNFGTVEWTSAPYLTRAETSGITGAMNMTWLSGPTTTALPPRVYDISLGFQTRQQWTSQFSYDLATSIGIFSDFEGSARDGVRCPSHAVGMLHIN